MTGNTKKIRKITRNTTDLSSSTITKTSLECYNLLLLNWYLLGMEMNLGHTHKTRFWYPLGLFSKFSDEHPRHFIGSTARDLCLWIQSSSTNQLEAPTQNAQVQNDIKKTALQGTYPRRFKSCERYHR